MEMRQRAMVTPILWAVGFIGTNKQLVSSVFAFIFPDGCVMWNRDGGFIDCFFFFFFLFCNWRLYGG